MTVLATRPAPSTPTRRAPRSRARLRRVAGVVLRWALAVLLIVVLGELLTPIEARAGLRPGATAL